MYIQKLVLRITKVIFVLLLSASFWGCSNEYSFELKPSTLYGGTFFVKSPDHMCVRMELEITGEMFQECELQYITRTTEDLIAVKTFSSYRMLSLKKGSVKERYVTDYYGGDLVFIIRPSKLNTQPLGNLKIKLQLF